LQKVKNKMLGQRIDQAVIFSVWSYPITLCSEEAVY